MVVDTLTVVAFCLIASFFLSEIAFKMKYPRVIGQLIAGIMFSFPFFRVLFSAETLVDIEFLSDMGIIFLLFLAGLELNLKRLKKAEKDSIIISIFGIVLPFLLGFIIVRVLGYSNITAFILGTCLAISAEGTTLKILFDMKALKTKVGYILIEAGLFDDLFGILFLAIALVFTQETFAAFVWFPVKLIIFVVLVYMTYKAFPRLLKLIHKEHSRITTFSFILIFAIVIAVLSKSLGLGPILGAFFAGVIINHSEKDRKEHKLIIKELEAMTFSFIIPFFFINIGLHFDILSFFSNIWMVLVIVIIATVGKVIGAIIATPFTDLSMEQTHLIGWGMNSRGAVELIIAEVARVNGLIPPEIYSAVVAMAIITTLIFPFVLRKNISMNPKVLG